MMYRPQFAYPAAPDGCEDQRFHYSFDATNCPRLAVGQLPAGEHTGRIPLLLDEDAPFILLAIQSFFPVFFGLEGGRPCVLQLRLETPNGEPMSDSGNVEETINYEFAPLYSNTDGAGLVTVDYAVWCPAGGALNLYINNPSTADLNLDDITLMLHGIKRYLRRPCND